MEYKPQYKVGDRVRITAAPEDGDCDQLGTIISIEKLPGGYYSPLILLDNGKKIGGWECWWEPADSPSHMPSMRIAVRESDIRRIGINCRCGKRSVAEIPQQIAAGLNLHPCPSCGAGYSITFRDKNWVVERITESIQDMTFEDEKAKSNKYKH